MRSILVVCPHHGGGHKHEYQIVDVDTRCGTSTRRRMYHLALMRGVVLVTERPVASGRVLVSLRVSRGRHRLVSRARELFKFCCNLYRRLRVWGLGGKGCLHSVQLDGASCPSLCMNSRPLLGILDVPCHDGCCSPFESAGFFSGNSRVRPAHSPR